MTYYVINFETVEAPDRTDGVPWVTVHVEQAAPETPTQFVEIDELPYTPGPFTTAKATIQTGWFRAWWEDADGARSRDMLPFYVGPESSVLFTVAEARAALEQPAYDIDKILSARAVIQDELESAVRFALVPTAVSETRTAAAGWSGLQLRPYIRRIFAVTIDGTALIEAELEQLHYADGILYGYPWNGRQVTVYYEHGLAMPSPSCKRAALALLADYLGVSQSGSIDPRAESIVTVDGTIRLRSDDGVFSNPIAAAWVNSNRIPVVG